MRSLSPWAILTACLAASAVLSAAALRAGDLSLVPLFDGERSDSLNLWGGPIISNNLSLSKQSTVVRSGAAAYRANVGTLPGDATRSIHAFGSAVHRTPGYRQDRDLTQYQSLEGYVRNDTGVPLTFSVQLKDHRDQAAQSATRSFLLPAGGWTRIEAPLDLADGWNVAGSPDLARTFSVSMLIDADYGAASGSLYLDDFSLREKGPSIDVPTAPIETIVERLARRQFHALWAARNKTSGLVPNTSTDVQLAALNTTTGVVWTLPAAVRRGWVAQDEADQYMSLLASSLNANRDQTTFLPTRFLNLVTAAPAGNREESSIDAAFIALALHNYKTQPNTPPALAETLDALQQRFNFRAFAGGDGYKLAYFPSGGGMTPYAYSGYTNENKVISLAGEVSEAHHVPLGQMWNKDVGRSWAWLVDVEDRFLTYSYSDEYRAPFVQALVNLFVDTRERGVDSFPDRNAATNPWVNFVRYQAEVDDRLVELGREHFVQPDAGQGAAGYKPYNLFNDFGQPNLFMPWSVAFALLAGAEHADPALRFLLDNGLTGGLDGPLGLADSAQWAAGAANPAQVPSMADNWNVTLSLLAWMELLEGPDRASLRFANLPEVASALDQVFRDGDFNGDGVTDAADLARWREGFDVMALATASMGDGDGDGDVDGADFLRWQRGRGKTTLPVAAQRQVPEPTALSSAAAAAIGLAVARRRPCCPRRPRRIS